MKQGSGALLFEPRMGKTKTTIDYLCMLAQRGDLDRAIIIAPNRVLGTWVREFSIHAPLSVRVSVWDAPARKVGPPPPVTGYYDLEVIILNYEAFAVSGRKTPSGRTSKASGRYKVRKQLRAWLDGKPAAGVLDESHKIKSPSGKAANFIVSMGVDFSHKLILTGTPITKAKRSFDIYMQWKFLNPDRFSHVGTVKEFKSHYGRWLPMDGYSKYLGPQNTKELQRLMRKDAIVARREDAFDLPPREDIVRFVKLKKAAQRAYRDISERMITELESGTLAEASIKLVQNLRLSQITSGFITDEHGDLQRFGFEKADTLKEIMEEMIELDEHLVVAARWVADLDLIEDLGKELGYQVYSIRGGISREDSDKALQGFRSADEPSLMVIQPSSAALGIDLSTASTMVWYSHTPSWVDFSQACDRIALSRNSTTFIHLIAEGSIDETQLEVLRQDGDMARTIMADPRKALEGGTLHVDPDGKIEVMKGKG